MQNPFDRFDQAPTTQRQGQVFTSPYRADEEERKRAAEARQNAELALRREAEARAAAAAARDATKDASAPRNTSFEQTTGLSKSYNADSAVKSYRGAIASYGSGLKAPKTAEGDLSLVYSFAKIMDPDSVVREGEAASVGNASPAVEAIAARIKKEFGMDAGGQFSPEGRERLKKAMQNRVAAYNSAYIGARKQYRSQAEAFGLDPMLVVGEHAGIPYQKDEESWQGKPVTQMDAQGNVIPGKSVLPEKSPQLEYGLARAQMQAMIRGGADYDMVSDFARGQGMTFNEKELRNAVALGRAEVRPEESTGMGIVKGMTDTWDRAAGGLETGINKTFGTNLTGAAEENARRQEYWNQTPTTEGGEMIGKGLAAAASTYRMGPMLGGAAGGMLVGDSNTPEGLIKDAAIGAATGKVADWGLRGLSNLISPRINPAVPRLGQQEVPMTIPTMVGGRMKAMEDAATSLPIVGPKIRAARAGSEAAVNVTAYNRALRAAGIKPPAGLAAGHEGVATVEKALGDQYQNTLSQMQVGLDRTFQGRMGAIVKRARLRPQEQGELQQIVQHEIGGAFANGPKISGRDYKMLDERLGNIATGFKAAKDDPYKRQLGQVISTVQEQMRALARRQNPGLADTIRKTDAGWAIYSRIRAAAAKSGNDGIASPAELMAAVRQGDRSVGRGATAKGDALLQDLAGDAQNVLPRAIGDSGTADRELTMSTKAWLAGLAMNPLYNETLRKGTQSLLTAPRHRFAQPIADAMRRLPGGTIGGIGGGMLLAPPRN